MTNVRISVLGIATEYIAWIAVCFGTFAIFILARTFSEGSYIFGNLFVPDGLTIYDKLDCDNLTSCFTDFDLLDDYKATLLYGLYGYIRAISPELIFVLNLALILHGGWRVNAFLETRGFAVLIIVPYFLVAASLPSKDILCFYLATYIVPGLWSKRWVSVALFTMLVYFVREGSGLMFAAFSGYVYVADRFSLTTKTSALALIPITLIAIYIGVDTIDVGKHYTELSLDTKDFVVDSPYPRAAINIFVNALHQWLRPNFLVYNILSANSILISVMGIAYWICGVTLVFAVYKSVKQVLFSASHPLAERSSLIALLILFFLLFVSINPIIQPRYIYIVLPFALSLFGDRRSMSLRYLILVGLCFGQLPLQLFFSFGGYSLFTQGDLLFPF